MTCRICESEASSFLSLGTTPLANNLLSAQDEPEGVFPLELEFCSHCKLVQLQDVIPPEALFKEYLYVTSTTKTFQKHFGDMADEVSQLLQLGSESLAVDIGSNDGLLLSGFQKHGVKTIGVEPAQNIAKIAQCKGVETICNFFNEQVVEEIIARRGKADVITATNVFAHIEDIHGVIRNVKNLLKKDGVFVIEVQYLLDMLEMLTFDNVYHEHLYYYSVLSLRNLFSCHDMQVYRVKHVDSHGGSLRVYVKRNEDSRPIHPSVQEFVQREVQAGMNDLAAYVNFSQKVEEVKKKFLSFMNTLKNEGKMIVGYGCPAKANTLLNYCGVGKEFISYIVDDNPLKQNMFTPGGRIPVVPSSKLESDKPDCVVILAWNFAPEILEKTKHLQEKGVKFIVPLPEPTIVG